MDMRHSEICSMLGDRIEQYNSANRKRKGNSSYNTLKKLKYAKIESLNKSSLSLDDCKDKILDETPRNVITQTPVSSLSFSSVTRTASKGTRNGRKLRRSVIIQPKRLSFDIEED